LGETIIVGRTQIRPNQSSPVYIPRSSEFLNLKIKDGHMKPNHGTLAMTHYEVVKLIWTEKKQRLVQKYFESCSRCKKFSEQRNRPHMAKLP
jgi:hypothetical protein